MNRPPVAKFRRKVAPRGRPTGKPKDRINEEPIVLASAAPVAGLARNQGFNDCPLGIAQSSPAQDHLLFSTLNQELADLGIL